MIWHNLLAAADLASVARGIRILTAGRAILVQSGWCQKSLGRVEGLQYQRCAMGGVNYGYTVTVNGLRMNVPAEEERVRLSLKGYDLAVAALTVCIMEREGVDFAEIAGWNDQPNRTKAEVLDLFTAAIAKLESIQASLCQAESPELELVT